MSRCGRGDAGPRAAVRAGLVQALSAFGNMLAAPDRHRLGQLEQAGAIGSAWRTMFVVGAAPGSLVILIFKRLKEPERGSRRSREKQDAGSMAELFTNPRWRRNAMVGMLLAFSGVVGLWGIGFFSFDLRRCWTRLPGARALDAR